MEILLACVMLLSGYGRSRKRLNSSLCEINITPFVDVMLVLLIVFMITSPMMVNNVNIELPRGASESGSVTNEPVTVTLDNAGVIYIRDQTIVKDALLNEINILTQNNKDVKIHIRGDKGINYGNIMDIIAMINAAGYSKVALVTASKK